MPALQPNAGVQFVDVVLQPIHVGSHFAHVLLPLMYWPNGHVMSQVSNPTYL